LLTVGIGSAVEERVVSGNLIKNPGFQTDENKDGIPDNWDLNPNKAQGAKGSRIQKEDGEINMEKKTLKIILSFATETAHSKRAHELIKNIAIFLSENNLKGNFHLTGDFARALRKDGRTDIINELKKHEIGYHCNKHGADPFMAGYLEENDWETGLAIFLQNELPGFKEVEGLVGKTPRYYTTEFLKAPQAVYGAYLMGMETIGYLKVPMRGNDAVWYCNCFIPSCDHTLGLEFLHREDIDSTKQGIDLFDQLLERTKRDNSNLIRLYTHAYRYLVVDNHTSNHPWDIYKRSNYHHYETWPLFLQRSPEATQRALERFKKVIGYVSQKDTEFVTYSEFKGQYKSNKGIWVNINEVSTLAMFLEHSLDAYTTDEISISPAESFGLILRAIRVFMESGKFPERIYMRNLLGPVRKVPWIEGPINLDVSKMTELLPGIDRNLDDRGYIPSAIDIGGKTIGPGQFLNGLLKIFNYLRAGKKLPKTIICEGNNLPKISQEDFFQQKMFTHNHRGTELYPKGFNGKKICEMCRLQSCSWKPAVMK